MAPIAPMVLYCVGEDGFMLMLWHWNWICCLYTWSMTAFAIPCCAMVYHLFADEDSNERAATSLYTVWLTPDVDIPDGVAYDLHVRYRYTLGHVYTDTRHSPMFRCHAIIVTPPNLLTFLGPMGIGWDGPFTILLLHLCHCVCT